MSDKPSLNPNLREFWETQADTKILKGGRASSKTWDAAGMAIFLATMYTLKFLCMRQFQNKIQQSVYAILCVQIERFGLRNEFYIANTEIRHRRTGSSFHFYGIHRDIAEIKGFEGADIGWIEEGEGLTKVQWNTIEPTIRGEGGECWILYNPRLESDFIETFKHDPENGVIVRQINYDENPFLSHSMLKKIERLKRSDYDEYVHVYLGIARKDDNDVVIKRSWIEAAVDAHLVLGLDLSGYTDKSVGYDIADSGEDLCSQVGRTGPLYDFLENWKAGEDELEISAARVFDRAALNGARVSYDSIGVGASTGSEFKRMNKGLPKSRRVVYYKFIAGAGVTDPKGFYIEPDEMDGESEGGVTNKDFFENLKAQKWWQMADKLRNTYNAVTRGYKFPIEEMVFISSEIDDLQSLITQLSTPRRKFSKSGKIMVESKEELKKRGIVSHNDADAFIMADYEGEEENNKSGGFGW